MYALFVSGYLAIYTNKCVLCLLYRQLTQSGGRSDLVDILSHEFHFSLCLSVCLFVHFVRNIFRQIGAE